MPIRFALILTSALVPESTAVELPLSSCAVMDSGREIEQAANNRRVMFMPHVASG
jgi:hypothetical protein